MKVIIDKVVLFKVEMKLALVLFYDFTYRDQEEDEEVLEDLRLENDRLSKELEEVRSKHTSELNR